MVYIIPNFLDLHFGEDLMKIQKKKWQSYRCNEKSQTAMLIRYPPHSKSQWKNLARYSSNKKTLVLIRRFQ